MVRGQAAAKRRRVVPTVVGRHVTLLQPELVRYLRPHLQRARLLLGDRPVPRFGSAEWRTAAPAVQVASALVAATCWVLEVDDLPRRLLDELRVADEVRSEQAHRHAVNVARRHARMRPWALVRATWDEPPSGAA